MSTKNCPKCNTVKTLDEFYSSTKKKDGKQGYCKDCMKAFSKEGYETKYHGKYVVYHLPKENYIGMTYNISKRISHHKRQHKRDVTNYRVILSTKSKWLAHMTETFLHMIGFNGFRY